MEAHGSTVITKSLVPKQNTKLPMQNEQVENKIISVCKNCVKIHKKMEKTLYIIKTIVYNGIINKNKGGKYGNSSNHEKKVV